MFDHNTTGVTESGAFEPIPEGTYAFEITKTEIRKSRNGDNQVNVTLTVCEGEYEGRKVFYLLTFLPPNRDGAGIVKRWLHAIGEEYEGRITVNPQQWGGTVTCDVKIDEYQGRKSNKITAVHLPEHIENNDKSVPAKQMASTVRKSEGLDDVPF